ncbi:MAG TPA: ABC transporter ATP-binding protein [Candidatus Limnocylindrales bacterium]|nr:ABC transporter ATP-binding protein [Candidatus Limnocylindrales bacterium]
MMTTTTTLAGQLRDLVRPWRGRLTLVAAGVLAAAGLDLLPPLIVRRVVDSLTAGATADLPVAAAAYLAAVAAVQVLTAGYGYLAATVAQRALAALRTRLFAHLLALDTDFHDRRPAGDAIARATADIDTIDDLFSSSIVTLLGDTVRLLTVTAAMLWLSPGLTAVVVIVIPPMAFFTGYLRSRIRDAERATRAAVGQATTQLHETLAGVEVVRAFGRQEQFAARFRATLLRWLSAGNTSTGFNAFYAPGLAVLSAGVTAGLLWVGGSGAAQAAGVSIGTLTAFVLLLARLFTPLINLGDEWQNVQAALAGAERVFGLLAEPMTQPVDRAFDRTAPPIELRGIGFAYQGGRPVLHDIDLEVAPGEHVALVGRSGAGKTTILALLTGLYRPTRGTVRLAGFDPAGLVDEQRRLLLGLVPQTVHLFTGTVRHNIALGDEAIGGEDIEHACRISGADSFIRALPQGYDTVLSDAARGDGVVLSAGQRQLLALARALAGRPRVLLLDEATAVVDGATDAAFRSALREHVQPRATAILTVAHRLATARDADRVIVLSAGRILEQGTPDRLLSTDSTFAALLAIEEAGWDWP